MMGQRVNPQILKRAQEEEKIRGVFSRFAFPVPLKRIDRHAADFMNGKAGKRHVAQKHWKTYAQSVICLSKPPQGIQNALESFRDALKDRPRAQQNWKT